MFKVTAEWIHAYKSGAGGWNKLQLKALNVAWPPRNGWIRALEGKEISNEAKYNFENLQGETSRKRRAVAAGETSEIYERRKSMMDFYKHMYERAKRMSPQEMNALLEWERTHVNDVAGTSDWPGWRS